MPSSLVAIPVTVVPTGALSPGEVNVADIADPRMRRALVRYQIISAYIAMRPKRGLGRKLLDELAARSWPGDDEETLTVCAETMRTWIRRYKRNGLAGLMDKPRPRAGVGVLTAEQAELVCKLKQEVPERSLDRVIRIAEDTGLIEKDLLTRSTVHRVLKSKGLSARKLRTPDAQDLDRFEADFPNDLWASDMLVGPWLPDPAITGKVRRANLFAFIDDHSRLLLHGRFSFRENLPALELVFRRALQRWGRPNRVHWDNALVYRSGHMRRIVAETGIHRIIFSKPKHPPSNGKMEAFNRLCRSAFIAELKASSISTLEALNEAFLAWVDVDYNRQVNSETGQAPIERWRAGAESIVHLDDEKLRQAFQWSEHRTPDKAGVFSLLGTRYQVGADLARRKIEVRFDPEALHEIEVWREGTFVQRVRPHEVHPWRRPVPKEQEQKQEAEPVADWLGHLVEKRRREGSVEPRDVCADAKARRQEADQAVLELLREKLDPASVDEATVRDYLDRFGPFDAREVAAVMDVLVADGQGRDRHFTFYLDLVRKGVKAGAS